MSNYLGIATVSEALRQLVQGGADEAFPGAEALVLRPPSNLSGNHPAGHPNAFAGVYLYQVTPNSAWRNAETPTRRSDGSVLRPTRAAFDLSYVISVYGDDNKMEPQMVLGAVLRRLSARPVLTKEDIINAKSSVLVTQLANSNLETEVEQVKFTMLPLSLEEMSKVWSIFFQTAYQLSVAYHAAVVFIDGNETPAPALPVQLRNVSVQTFESPVIERVFPQPQPGDPPFAIKGIVSGDTLVLSGFRLQGDVTLVRVGATEITPDTILPTEITATLDAPPFPADTLRAGVQGVQVLHRINMGTPETEHKGFESNVAAFVLRPTVTPGAVNITSTSVVDATTFHDATVDLTFTPRVGVEQRVAVLLNELNPPSNRPAYSYQFDPKVTPVNPTDISVATLAAELTHVASAKYLVRVQVDGAESLLEADANPLDPKYIAPLVDLT
jgi:uncharacterized protein DUF4255